MWFIAANKNILQAVCEGFCEVLHVEWNGWN